MHKFYQLVKPLAEGKTEKNPLKLGNAEFWIEDNELVHYPHSSKWDSNAVSKDLNSTIKFQLSIETENNLKEQIETLKKILSNPNLDNHSKERLEAILKQNENILLSS